MRDYDIDYIDDPFIEEMIDGKIYLMARPNNRHMLLQSNVSDIFKDYFKRKKKKCMVVNEMQLYINERNYFQPDLLIYCKDNNDKKNKKIPLIVIEILSDSTWKIDITSKMKKYAEADIEEYWIIDPRNQRINIYKLDGGRYELSELYNYPVRDGFSVISQAREKEESEIVKEFSPRFFPEMTIKLEDIFNFDDLELIE